MIAKRKLLISIGVYFASILLFAFTYLLIWMSSPDSFIMDKETNLLPYRDAFVEAPTQPPTFFRESAELDQMYFRVVRPTIESIESMNRELSQLEARRGAVEDKLRAAASAHMQAAEDNRMRLEEQELGPLIAEIKSLENTKAHLDKLDSDSPGSPGRYGIVSAETGIQIAQRKVEYHQRRAQIFDKFLKEFPTFADQDKLSAFQKLVAEGRSIETQVSKISTDVRELQYGTREKIREWYRSRIERLGFFEFLYFSIGVSTTATFGDIIPNSRIVRIAVSIQLLISIIVVGYFLSLIAPTGRDG